MAGIKPKPIPRLTQQDVDRFLSKVQRLDDANACWPWKAGAVKSGYGVFWADGKSFYAHRIALHLERGNIESDLLTLHQCDNPGCCNPAHLYSGTHKNNAEDREKRGRSHPRFGDDNPSRKHPELMRWSDQHALRLHPELISRGERHGSKTKPWRVARGERSAAAKLKTEDVLEIRRLYSLGQLGREELATKFNVTVANIHYIVCGKSWRHLL